jgi:hypothetical protein
MPVLYEVAYSFATDRQRIVPLVAGLTARSLGMMAPCRTLGSARLPA